MIYQFNSEAAKSGFSGISYDHKCLADFVKMDPFTFDDHYVRTENQKAVFGSVESGTIINDLRGYCTIKGEDQEGEEETRDSKIERLYQLILRGQIKSKERELIQVNDDVKLQFHNGSGGKGVGIFYCGSYDFSILTKDEQGYLWNALEQLEKNQVYQKKLDFFNSLKF